MVRQKVSDHAKEEFARVRYPAIARSSSGALLLMWEALPAKTECDQYPCEPADCYTKMRHAAVGHHIFDCFDQFWPTTLFFSRSFDNGRTWEPSRVFSSGLVPDSDKSVTLGLHNPSFLLDHVTGRLFCFYTQSAVSSDEKKLSFHVAWTDDDGAQWNHRDITKMIIAGREFDMAYVPRGRGTQLSAGSWSQRLAHAGVVIDRQGNRQAVFIGSDDQGITWWSSEPVGANVDYCSAIQNADATKVYLLMRDRETGDKSWAISEDGGRHFGVPTTDVDYQFVDLLSPLERVFPGAAAQSEHANVVTYIGERKFCSGDCTVLMLSTDDAKNFIPAAWFDTRSYSSIDVVSVPDQGFFAVVSEGAAGIMFETLAFKTLPIAKMASEWMIQE